MTEIELLNLLNQNHEYLQFQVRNILRNNPRLCRWIQAEDVAQNILIRMYRCIKDENLEIFDQQHFIRLMSTQLRREVIDLYRKHFGPYGMGTHLKTDPHAIAINSATEYRRVPTSATYNGPESDEEWSEFHEKVDQLPAELKQVFELIWYSGFTEVQASEILEVSERTVRRRWRDARIQVQQRLTLCPSPLKTSAAS